MEYTAFISYRHTSPDAEIAAKLHTLIENYHIPKNIKEKLGMEKMGRVFRDEEELPLSTDLGGDIYKALDASEWLIVICSPAYLESKWCQAELDYFISIGKRDRILTVLADGEPGNAFPEQLRFIEKDGERKEIEPLAADVRADSTAGSLKQLSSEKLRILAPMLGVTYDDLRQRAQKRRFRIISSASAAGIALLTAFLIFALVKNAQIKKQRDLALDNQMQLLIEEANISSSGGNKLSALSSLKEASALRDDIGNKHDTALSAALEYALYTEALEPVLTIDSNNRSFTKMIFSQDDRYLLGITNLNSACLIDAATGRIIHTVSRSDLGQLDDVGFTLDGKYFYMVDSWYSYVSLYSVEDGKLFAEYSVESDIAQQIGEEVFPVDDTTLLILKDDAMVLWNYIKKTEKEILPCGDGFFESYTKPVIVSLSPSRDSVAIGSHGYGAGMKILSLDGSKETQLEFDPQRGYGSMKFSGDGRYLAGASASLYYVWDVSSGKQILSGGSGIEDIDVQINYDGSIILVMKSTDLRAIDVKTGDIIWEKTNESNIVTECSISSNGIYVSASGGISGIFDIRTGEVLYPYDATLFSNDSSKVITGGLLSSPSLLVTPLFATEKKEESYSGTLYSAVRYTDPGKRIMINLRHNPGDIYINAPGRKTQSYTSEDIRYAAWTHADGFIEVFDLSENKEEYDSVYCIAEHCFRSVEDLVFNGSLMASCGGFDPRCVLFDLEKGNIRYVLAGDEYCHRAEFSKDGTKIIILCGLQKDKAYVYSTESGALLYEFECQEGERIKDIGFDEEKGKVVALLEDGSAYTGIIYSSIEEMLK